MYFLALLFIYAMLFYLFVRFGNDLQMKYKVDM